MMISPRFMFQANAFLALLNGLIYLFAPALIARLPVIGSSFVEAPHMLGDTFCGAVQLGFGVCGWLGLKHPEKFMSVLLLQCIYKTAFLCTTVFHYSVSGRLAERPTPYEWFVLGTFVFFAVGDGLALLEQEEAKTKTKKAT